jgi:hypothetical protein
MDQPCELKTAISAAALLESAGCVCPGVFQIVFPFVSPSFLVFGVY